MRSYNEDERSRMGVYVEGVDLLTINGLKKYYDRTEKYPKHFGLGFFQLKVNPAMRLHFYNRDFGSFIDEEEVHDHRYDFTSHVLIGELVNALYTYNVVNDSDWELASVMCKDTGEEEPVTVLANVDKVLLGKFITPEGHYYDLKKEAFHRVEYYKNTVTMLVRPENADTEYAHVIRNKKTPYVCPFSAPMKPEEVWKALEPVLGR